MSSRTRSIATMKTALALALIGIVGAAITVVWWQGRTDARSHGSGNAATASGMETSPPSTGDAVQQPRAAPAPGTGQAGTGTAEQADAYAERAAARSAKVSTPTWPTLHAGTASGAAAATGEPAVPVKVAFRALWYLGTDPGAEKTWSRAINDPNMPAEVRSDLIIDMIDEGYTDNDKPGKADLPVILARLGILERHAPNAMDEVNRKAFQDAYRHMLELYARLGGDPARR